MPSPRRGRLVPSARNSGPLTKPARDSLVHSLQNGRHEKDFARAANVVQTLVVQTLGTRNGASRRVVVLETTTHPVGPGSSVSAQPASFPSCRCLHAESRGRPSRWSASWPRRPDCTARSLLDPGLGHCICRMQDRRIEMTCPLPSKALTPRRHRTYGRPRQRRSDPSDAGEAAAQLGRGSRNCRTGRSPMRSRTNRNHTRTRRHPGRRFEPLMRHRRWDT